MEKNDRVRTEYNGATAVKKSSGLHTAFKMFGRTLLIILETVLLLAVALYGVMYVLCKGPSVMARNLFVMSVRETSAIGFLANIYFTDEEIAEIEAGQNSDAYVATDTSMININTETTPAPQGESPQADAWGLVDDDGDGIIVEEVNGSSYSGYMMVVLDPSRVIMGTIPTSYNVRGYTVAEMVEEFDAVAGLNAGGFYDPDGMGNGSIPDSLVVYKGKIHCADFGIRNGFVGFDDKNIMHVGRMSVQEIEDSKIQYGVCFGPTLVANGEPVDSTSLGSGLNPRSAIGQRSDGAVLLLVIDGRQVISLGASYQDLSEIMIRYGAVNAMNLDGGSSSLLWYQGGYINNCASVIGIRPVPTAILVLKEGASND